jgi:hypothetical protein
MRKAVRGANLLGVWFGTWVTVPREPVRPMTSLTRASLGRVSVSLSCTNG